RAAWGDYNNDGLPDLFLVGASGAENRLFLNSSNGIFTKVTNSQIDQVTGIFNTAAWADYDNDGSLDLFLSSHDMDLLFHSRGNGTFTNVAGSALPTEHYLGFGCAWADYERDGFVDLFVANRSHDVGGSDSG